MDTTKFFEWYVTYAWPIVRHVVPLSKRCKRCIVSEHYAPLTNGLCEACTNYRPVAEEAAAQQSEAVKKQFDEHVRSYIRGDGYHAILMLSGGKDSAYILERLRTEFPALKILCVIVNNGFMSPLAIDGATFAADKTGTDFLIANAYTGEFAQNLRKAFLELDGRGGSGVIDFTDGDTIFKIGQRIASELKIPMIFSGMSWVQVQMIVGHDHFEHLEKSGINITFPLAVWRTDEQEIRRIVREKGLLPPGADSPLRTNSTLITAMTALDIYNLGYCSFEPEFAQLVREGKTSRKVWLHIFELLEFATKKGILNKDIDKVLAQLRLTRADVIKPRTT